MSSTLLPSVQGKSWWLRSSKSSRDASNSRSSRPSSSQSSVSEKANPTMPSGTGKMKDSGSGLNFKTIGSAMGLKSRKLPSLAIQDPPAVPARVSSPLVAHPISGSREAISTLSTPYTNSTIAKPFSPAHCSECDGDGRSAKTASEPRTPSDSTRDRTSYQPSVLTFSEPDPFAAGGVIIQQTPNDPNRLSVYSDSSLLDPHRKSGDVSFYNHIPYGSSPSIAPSLSSDSHSGRVASAVPIQSRSRTNSTMRWDATHPLPVSHVAQLRQKSPSVSSSSCSTVTAADAANRLSEPPAAQLVHQRVLNAASRPRGQTIAVERASHQRRPNTANAIMSLSAATTCPPLQLRRKASDLSFGLHSSSSSTASSPSPLSFMRSRSSTMNSAQTHISQSSTRPMVVIRKPSSTRMVIPPLNRAPPSAELPPPPLSPTLSQGTADSFDDLSAFPDPPSSSSSSMSFAPSMDRETPNMSGDVINHFMRQAFGYSGKRHSGKSKAKDQSTGQNHAQANSPTSLRDIELRTASISSASKSPPFPPVSEDGSIRNGGGLPRISQRSLKKATSQQSLANNRYSATSLASSLASGHMGHDDAVNGKHSNVESSGSKIPRKQRSFHHPRLPLPPLPNLRYANSSTSTTSEFPLPSSPVSPEQQRRGSMASTGPTSARKRLFSTSSVRRSTSSQPPASPSLSGEDDKRSIYSVEELRAAGQVAMSFGNFGNSISLSTKNSCVAPLPYWEEPHVQGGSSTALNSSTSDLGGKRLSQAEYVPQHIMSPADMLELEKQLADEAAAQEYDRNRAPKLELNTRDLSNAMIQGRQKAGGQGSKAKPQHKASAMSTATVAFGSGDSWSRGSPLSPPPISSSKSAYNSSKPKTSQLEPTQPPHRSISMLQKGFSRSTTSARPSTAQPNVSPSSSSVPALTHSPEQANVSLPPPPRARPKPVPSQSRTQPTVADKRSSTVPIQPLSPPPVRKTSRAQSSPMAPARSSPSFAQRPPSAFDQHVLQGRSIMRKPSFLDIEDEVEVVSDSSVEKEVETFITDDNFLDMERGKDSFDTVRSSDSMLYV